MSDNEKPNRHPRITILILGYDSRNDLPDVFSSVSKQDYPSYDIIFIDNASHDSSVAYCRKHFQKIRVIENKRNIGYAGAYAAALSDIFADNLYDAAVLLNPDTIVDNHWLSELVASAYRKPDIGFAQSKILIWKDGKTNKINTFGNSLHFLGIGFCSHYQETDGADFKTDTRVAYPSGASFLVKRNAYQDTQGMDADFFCYLEDADLAWQGNLRGWKSIVSSKSIVWHKYDFAKKQYGGFKFYHLERNRFAFLLKHFEWKTIFLIAPAFLLLECGILLHSIRNGYFLTKIKSYFGFLQMLPTTLRKRRSIQASRTVTDQELLPLLSPTIAFEDIQSGALSVANTFFKWYYERIKKLI